MTALLNQAVAAVSALPDVEQDAVAALMFAEIEADRQWEESFARSASKLEALAARAAEQVKAGQCRVAGIDEL